MAKREMPQLNVSQKVTGLHTEIWGDFRGIWGDVSKIFGCITDLKGDATGIEGDVSNISGDFTHIVGIISEKHKGDVSKFHGDITGSMEFNKCTVCKNKGPIVFRNFRGRFCRDCYPRVCVNCKEELTAQEIEYLPMYGNPRFKKDEKGEPRRLCTKCYLENLVRIKDEELKRVAENFDFQIRHQICSCGKFNDSRSENGILISAYCQECRKLYGEKIIVDNILSYSSLPKNFSDDKRTVPFNRVTGFKERK